MLNGYMLYMAHAFYILHLNVDRYSMLPSEGPANFLLPCFLKIEKSFNIKKYTLED